MHDQTSDTRHHGKLNTMAEPAAEVNVKKDGGAFIRPYSAETDYNAVVEIVCYLSLYLCLPFRFSLSCIYIPIIKVTHTHGS